MTDERTTEKTRRLSLERPSWTRAAVGSSAVVVVVWSLWTPPSLFARILRDAALYGTLALGLALFYDRDVATDLGLTVDRAVIRATVGLTLFVLPFYVVGASIPSMRAGYPLWPTAATLPAFLPHALGIVVMISLTEAYYRGLLCVGLRRLGPACVFLHLPAYVYVHLTNPGIEVVMSGVAGVLFGVVAYRTRSILPTVVAHSLGFVVLDFLVLRPPLVPWVGDVLPV